MNSIIKLLDLEDTEIFVSDIKVEGTQKLLLLKQKFPHTIVPAVDSECIPEGLRQGKYLILFFRMDMRFGYI